MQDDTEGQLITEQRFARTCLVAELRQQCDAVKRCMNDQPERRKHDDEYMRLVRRIAEGFFRDDWKHKPEEQKRDCQFATAHERFGNDIHAGDTSDRNEYKAVQYLPGGWLPSAQCVDARAKK